MLFLRRYGPDQVLRVEAVSLSQRLRAPPADRDAVTSKDSARVRDRPNRSRHRNGTGSVRRLIAFLVVGSVLVSCEQATPPPSPSPSTPVAGCAPPIAAGSPLSLRLTTVDKPIGSSVIFGLNGAFLGSSFGSPLGANRVWTLADEQLRTTCHILCNIG